METLNLNSIVPTQPAARGVEEWITEINQAFGFSVGWLVSTGQLLCKAKGQLEHGQWASMFSRGKLRFGIRTAQMLMKVSEHATLRNAKYISYFPPAWSVLYELSKLPAELLEQEIATGAVHPELKLAEARQIVHRVQGKPKDSQRKPHKKIFNLERQRTRLTTCLAEQVSRWPKDHYGTLAELLEETASNLRTGGDKP